MRIWLIDHYAVPPKYYPLARQTTFAKHLMQKGHEVLIIAASTVHNSRINLVEGEQEYTEQTVDGVRYLLIRCRQYSGNGLSRFANMMEFAAKLPKVCGRLPRPDAIVSCSMTLFACAEGLKLSKKYGCRRIAQITDLWPESIVAYGVAPSYHPVVPMLRILEKWIYKHSDAIIFSMEGAYDYILERGWEKDVPRDKVFFINNGVDLKLFDSNRERYQIDDPQLRDPDLFKVVYTGAIRKANNLGRLLDIAKLVRDERVRFLVWGDGDELEALKLRQEREGIGNVCFKGRVEKKYVPYITSCADLNLMHVEDCPILRFGISPNKLFDYFAAGKPVLSDFPCPYNPAITYHVSDELPDLSPAGVAGEIDRLASLDREALAQYGLRARKAAEAYEFDVLTQKLLDVIEGKATEERKP